MALDKKIIDELMDFIQDKDKKFLSQPVPSDEKRVRILARAVKLGEEVGELYNDVLGYLGLQRQSKLDAFTLENLEEEMVDVLITLLILAVLFPEINLKKAIHRKIEKIKARS